MANISERIKELREEARLSQDELAQKVNMSRISIGNYERGIRTPDAANIIRIATFFKVSTDYLLGLSDIKSIDINVRAICDYTGLSENAVSCLREELTGERRKEPPHEKYSVPLLQQFINTLLEGADWVLIEFGLLQLLENYNIVDVPDTLSDIKDLFNLGEEVEARTHGLYRLQPAYKQIEELYSQTLESFGEVIDKLTNCNEKKAVARTNWESFLRMARNPSLFDPCLLEEVSECPAKEEPAEPEQSEKRP